MNIQLSEHFTYHKLLRFVFPSIVMMIFTSIYVVVDGLFVSNFVGKTPFAAVNLIYPFLMILGALGFMLGTGGSAIVSKTLGEGKPEKANQYFSMLVYAAIVGGIVLALAGFVSLRPIAKAIGAEGATVDDCVLYGRFILPALPAFMLQNVFQSFFVAAEKPHLGLKITVAAGCTNMLLDFLLVAVFPFGLAGAAVATAVSQLVGGLVPLFYFGRPNGSLLRLTSAKLDLPILAKACTNGFSELMTNVSLSLVNILYNIQLIRVIGEDGVAAYGVIMYVNFIFIAIFLGYAVGSAPIVSYHYGAGNPGELKGLFCKSLVITAIAGIFLTAAAMILSLPLSKVFVGYDAGLLELTCHGFQLFSFSFLFSGFNIFGSAFFTALNNGFVSAAISFLRTLVFQIAVVLVLPVFMGLDGIWLAAAGAELLALVVTVLFFVRERKTYRYA